VPYRRAGTTAEARHRLVAGVIYALPVIVLAAVVALFNTDAGWVVLGVAVIVVGVVAEIRLGSRREQR
jgi:hypothetical protein